MQQLPKVIAHRGASQIAPENTLIAFEQAYHLGARWVEFDVMPTADQILIVHHDATFARILGLALAVGDTPYAQIEHQDAGSWFNPRFHLARIPTLLETISCCARLGLGMNIELKVEHAAAQDTALQTLAMLSQFEFFSHENVLISSQEPAALEAVYRHAPAYKLGLVASSWNAVEHALSGSFKLYSLNLHYSLLTAEKMADLHAQGYAILAFTVNDQALADRLFHLGVVSVFSDNASLYRPLKKIG